MSLQAGTTVLAARYRLEEVIGRGGMSTVYRASDQVLRRTVAVKILLAVLAEQDPTYTTRFEREARAAAALDDPTVVTIYDTGMDDGNHYIVMEYIVGRSLEQILGGGLPLEVAEAERIAAAVAGALASAHVAGILHRDIKPANVMVTDMGNVKVLDFGIARSLDGTAITQVASVVGTAAYMAPERALGGPGDARADIYSLGCLLYAMLTGRPPFTGELSAAVLHQQINAEPRSPAELRPAVPAGLDALVLAMLAKSPDTRPATAAEVRDRLANRDTASTIRLAPAAARPAGASPARAREALMADHRRRAIVMALVTALITLVAVALFSGGGSADNATSHSRAATTAPRPTATSTSHATSPAQTTPPAAAATPPGHGAPPGQGGRPPGKPPKPGKTKKQAGDGGD